MKSSKEIVEHIIKNPQNKKILQKRCFEKLKNLLPSHLKSAVLFVYIKNKTLFFVLNHPGIKMEFNYKHNLIKDLLNKIKEIDKDCQDIEIERVKSFVSNKIEIDKEFKKVQYFYKERSLGEFKIETDNKELREIFQKIQNIIKSRESEFNK